jgi:hypothetical protein
LTRTGGDEIDERKKSRNEDEPEEEEIARAGMG